MALRVTSLVVFLLAGAAHADCAPDVIDLRHDGAKVQFKIDIADTDETRARGLMHVPAMPKFTGMLFIYDRPVHAAFWMRNTLIPLDMLFMDKFGRVQHIHENAIPHDETTIDGGSDILAVLEINGGLARVLGLDVGAEARHPAFEGPDAAWSCAD